MQSHSARFARTMRNWPSDPNEVTAHISSRSSAAVSSSWRWVSPPGSGWASGNAAVFIAAIAATTATAAAGGGGSAETLLLLLLLLGAWTPLLSVQPCASLATSSPPRSPSPLATCPCCTLGPAPPRPSPPSSRPAPSEESAASAASALGVVVVPEGGGGGFDLDDADEVAGLACTPMPPGCATRCLIIGVYQTERVADHQKNEKRPVSVPGGAPI